MKSSLSDKKRKGKDGHDEKSQVSFFFSENRTSLNSFLAHKIEKAIKEVFI